MHFETTKMGIREASSISFKSQLLQKRLEKHLKQKVKSTFNNTNTYIYTGTKKFSQRLMMVCCLKWEHDGTQ